MVLLGDGPPNPDFGESRDPNGLYGVQEVFGRARFPPNPSRPQFLGNLLVLGNFGQGPWPSPIGPLWANRAYFPCLGSCAWVIRNRESAKRTESVMAKVAVPNSLVGPTKAEGSILCPQRGNRQGGAPRNSLGLVPGVPTGPQPFFDGPLVPPCPFLYRKRQAPSGN